MARWSFDPRPRAGADEATSQAAASESRFRSTAPRGGRRLSSNQGYDTRGPSAPAIALFRSTAPRGGRPTRRSGFSRSGSFRSTAPRGGRLFPNRFGRNSSTGFDPRHPRRPPRGAVDRNHTIQVRENYAGGVGPRAGPWIETRRGVATEAVREGRPPRGAVDRNAVIAGAMRAARCGRPPRGAVDRNRIPETSATSIHGSAPARGRGSKRLVGKRDAHSGRVGPPRGAVDRNPAEPLIYLRSKEVGPRAGPWIETPASCAA